MWVTGQKLYISHINNYVFFCFVVIQYANTEKLFLISDADPRTTIAPEPFGNHSDVFLTLILRYSSLSNLISIILQHFI